MIAVDRRFTAIIIEFYEHLKIYFLLFRVLVYLTSEKLRPVRLLEVNSINAVDDRPPLKSMRAFGHGLV